MFAVLVVRDRHGDAQHGGAGRECQHAALRGVVRTGRGGCVRGRIVHDDGASAGRFEANLESHGAVVFGHGCVGNAQLRRRVVVLDGAGRRQRSSASGQGHARVAQGHRHNLVVLVERVVEHDDLDGLHAGGACREAQRAGRGRVVGYVGGRVVGVPGGEVCGYDAVGGAAQGHHEGQAAGMFGGLGGGYRQGGNVHLHDGDRHRSGGVVIAAAACGVRDLHRRVGHRVAVAGRCYGHRLRRTPVVGGERQFVRL